MQGFFEHQYLSYKKSHLANLVKLAAADGTIDDVEIDFLHKIGKKYGLKSIHVEMMLVNTEQIELYIPDDFDTRIDLLFDLVGMMLADGVIDEKEADFCEQLAAKYGYKAAIIQELVGQHAFRALIPERYDNFKKEKASSYLL